MYRTCNTPIKLLLSPATTSHRVWVCGGWGWRMELNSQRDKQPQWFGRSINHPGYFTNYHDHHPTSSPPPQNNNNKAPHPNVNACFGTDLVQQQQSGDQKWRLRKVFDDSGFNKNPSFTFSFTTIPVLVVKTFSWTVFSPNLILGTHLATKSGRSRWEMGGISLEL